MVTLGRAGGAGRGEGWWWWWGVGHGVVADLTCWSDREDGWVGLEGGGLVELTGQN